MNFTPVRISIFFFLTFLLLTACGGSNPTATNPVPVTETPIEATPVSGEITVTFSGGYETDPRDKGRPVVLIASALGVSEDIFREAFSHVKPAGPGQEPEPEQVNLNKKALMDVLGKYGVTNERLDEVSNYYRYNASAGETWPHTPATATATLENGVVTRFIITNPGAGYTSLPTVTVPGAENLRVLVTISYTTDFKTNGAVTELASK